MKKDFHCIFYMLLLMCFTIHSKDIIQFSIPKAGTHLLQKCISLLTGKKVKNLPPGFSHPKHYYHIKLDKLQQFLQFRPNDVFVVHLMYDLIYLETIPDDQYTKFFIYRDPRDQIISFIFYILSDPRRWPMAVGMSKDEMIFDLIYFGKIANNDPPELGINDLYNRYLPWLKQPGICAIRFEELIGPQGGGSLELQIKAIKKIADHIGIEVTDKKIEYVKRNLFGGTYTFRKGKIGEWKNYFTEDHKKAFKEVAGQLLIDLGYEKDFNW